MVTDKSMEAVILQKHIESKSKPVQHNYRTRTWRITNESKHIVENLIFLIANSSWSLQSSYDETWTCIYLFGYKAKIEQTYSKYETFCARFIMNVFFVSNRTFISSLKSNYWKCVLRRKSKSSHLNGCDGQLWFRHVNYAENQWQRVHCRMHSVQKWCKTLFFSHRNGWYKFKVKLLLYWRTKKKRKKTQFNRIEIDYKWH